MKTDPRTACANVKERLFWALLHDLVAHPLMALTNYSKTSLRFHDYTSFHAWPRLVPAGNTVHLIESRRFGRIAVTHLGGQFYSTQHPTGRHRYVTTAADAIEALEKSEQAFEALEEMFGGEFSARRQHDR